MFIVTTKDLIGNGRTGHHQIASRSHGERIYWEGTKWEETVHVESSIVSCMRGTIEEWDLYAYRHSDTGAPEYIEHFKTLDEAMAELNSLDD